VESYVTGGECQGSKGYHDVKLLGVFLERKLLHHCDLLATLKTVYCSYCQSILLYCITNWGCTCNGNVSKLLVGQSEIIRIMT